LSTSKNDLIHKNWSTDANGRGVAAAFSTNFSPTHKFSSSLNHSRPFPTVCSQAIAMVMHHKPTYATFVRYRSSNKKYMGR